MNSRDNFSIVVDNCYEKEFLKHFMPEGIPRIYLSRISFEMQGGGVIFLCHQRCTFRFL